MNPSELLEVSGNHTNTSYRFLAVHGMRIMTVCRMLHLEVIWFSSVLVWESPRVLEPFQGLSVADTTSSWTFADQAMTMNQRYHLLWERERVDLSLTHKHTLPLTHSLTHTQTHSHSHTDTHTLMHDEWTHGEKSLFHNEFTARIDSLEQENARHGQKQTLELERRGCNMRDWE